MRFTFDPAKDARNRAERGFGFAFAARIFEGATLEATDTRRDYGETRINALGAIEGKVFHVTYTPRGADVLHIISARLASRKERRLWLTRTPRP